MTYCTKLQSWRMNLFPHHLLEVNCRILVFLRGKSLISALSVNRKARVTYQDSEFWRLYLNEFLSYTFPAHSKTEYQAISRKIINNGKINPFHFVFAPYLQYFDEEGDFIKEEQKVTEELHEFINGKYFHHIPDGIAGNFTMFHYYFDGTYLHIWMGVATGTTKEEMHSELWSMNPAGGGRDGWMSGDVYVNDDSDFAPKLHKLYRIEDGKEVEITDIELCPGEPRIPIISIMDAC